MNGHPETKGQSQMQVAIASILETLSDKSQIVRETGLSSLKKLAEKHSKEVISSCVCFCQKELKPSNEHVASTVTLMENICNDFLSDIDGETVLSMVSFLLTTMTENVGYSVVQMPCCAVLVAIGRKHHIQVIEKLFEAMDNGEIPHYMIPHTLGSLANVNPHGIVPHLKKILSIIVPLLGGLKSDVFRQSFVYALGCFCDALSEYMSNHENVPDKSITAEDFQLEINISYETIVMTWLQSREPKVLETVLIALTSIYPLLDVDKVSQHTSKLVTTLLSLYKKNVDGYFNTKCLYAVIKKGTTVNGMLLDPLLGNIYQSLSDHLCISPDYAQPELLRCHSEVLRCYECLATHFTDSIVDQLISQLKNNNDKEKIKGILIISHLTAYLNEHTMERRLKDIIKHLNELLNEHNIHIKKALLKVISVFAKKGVLLSTELNSDGPEKYMEFILKLCCSQMATKNNDINSQDFNDLQKEADNTLSMLSSSVVELETVLWQLLMKCLLSPNYDDALVVLIRCLTHLAMKKEEIPCCEDAFIRCCTLLPIPITDFRGTFILNFLSKIKPFEDDSYQIVWSTKLPQLQNYLEQNYDSFHESEWIDLVSDFFELLIQGVKDESCIENLIMKARKQLDLYNGYLHHAGFDPHVKLTEKKFLLKSIAMLLSHVKDKDLILLTLDCMLLNIKVTNYAELQACSEAIGICSKQHLQIVLAKLALIRRELLTKKSSKFLQFRFIKDQKHDIENERLRYIVINSYSEICNQAPSEQLLRIIQSEMIDFVVSELKSSKDLTFQKICLKAISNIADAMHPNRNSLHIQLQSRDEILQLVCSQMLLHNGPEYIELFPTILPVITSLARLPLPLETDQRLKLLKLCFDNVYNASAIYCKINPNSSESYYGSIKLVPFIVSSFTKLNLLVQDLLLLNLNPVALEETVTLLEGWLGKKKQEQRLPAIETLRIALQTYLDNMTFGFDGPKTFGQTGFLLSRIIPRCTDPNNNIRKVAVECLSLVLCIASRYEGHMRDHDKLLSNSLQHIQQKIDSDDSKVLYNLTADIAHTVATNLPQFQLIHYVDGLIDSLRDCEDMSSNGSGVVLNLTLKAKGADLQIHINHLVNKLLSQIRLITYDKTKTVALRSLQSLASHYSKISANILLQQSLPFDSCVCDCWTIISTDPTLALDIIDQLKKIIKQNPLYEEQANGEIKLASLVPLQAVSALHELFKNGSLQDTCIQQFPELFSLLLITLASYIGTAAPVLKSNGDDKKEKYMTLNRDAYKLYPAKVALETFRLFLQCCQYNEMASGLLNYPHMENAEGYQAFLGVVSMLVGNICKDFPNHISWIVSCLGPYIRADFEPQRIAVVAFFTYLLQQKANDQTVLAENLLEMILDVQMDQSCFVKQLGLQALGFSIENLNSELISRHCNPILSVLMNSLDYNNIGTEGAVILEGLLSFSKLLTTLEGQKFSTCQVTAAVRIKPLLGQEDVNLRRASFRLLGDLTQSLGPEANIEAFREQIQGNLVTLLLHLCDPDLYVIKACKYTLRQVGPYLNAPNINLMIQEHLIDEAQLSYKHFIKDLIKVMGDELQEIIPLFVMTSLTYLKSSWIEVRSNAALMVGLFYGQLNNENRNKVSLDTVCYRLMILLNDEHEEVRTTSVQALGFLFLN